MLDLKPSALKFIGANPDEFLKAVQSVSDYLEILPEWLLTCMYMESDFNPKAVNPMTNATGLIQFMPATAKDMGVTVEYIKNKSAIQQMILVQQYFKSRKGKLKSITDVYLHIFYPLAIGKPDSFIIGIEKSIEFSKLVAKQNKVYDYNRDGRITKGEIKKHVESVYFYLYPEQKKKVV